MNISIFLTAIAALTAAAVFYYQGHKRSLIAVYCLLPVIALSGTCALIDKMFEKTPPPTSPMVAKNTDPPVTPTPQPPSGGGWHTEPGWHPGMGGVGQAEKPSIVPRDDDIVHRDDDGIWNPPTVTRNKWYEGGSLSNKGILDWQTASYEDKLATCGDMVSYLFNQHKLNTRMQDSIRSMDGIKVYAAILVTSIDNASRPDPNSVTNYNTYANQTVAQFASMIMVLAGWTQ